MLLLRITIAAKPQPFGRIAAAMPYQRNSLANSGVKVVRRALLQQGLRGQRSFELRSSPG